MNMTTAETAAQRFAIVRALQAQAVLLRRGTGSLLLRVDA